MKFAHDTTSQNCSLPSAIYCTPSSTCTATTHSRTPRSFQFSATSGAGKTHLPHLDQATGMIRRGSWQLKAGNAWLLIRRIHEFLEYLLFLGSSTRSSAEKAEGRSATLTRLATNLSAECWESSCAR